MYKKEILPNGFRIVTHDIKNRDSIALGFWIGAGGRYETSVQKGIAHLIEHIVFKGSQKYSGIQIKELIEGVGGTLNAFTSEEHTCFFAKIPSKHLEQTFDVLSDMVFFPKVKPQDLAKEKTVIIEEIKMYHDLPQYLVMDLLHKLMWPNNPLGESLAGTAESVSQITVKNIKDFHGFFYAPNNVVLSACGNVNVKELTALLRKKLGKLKSQENPSYEKVSASQEKPRTHYHHKDIEQMHLALGVPSYDKNHQDKHALELLSIILGGNMSSRLFREVREKKGLAYAIQSKEKAFYDTGYFVIRAGVDNKKIVQATEVVLKELEKIRTKPISKDEFIRAKDYKLGQLLLELEDTMEHMLWLGENVIALDKIETISQVIRVFEKITPQDVTRVAQDILQEARLNLSIVGPVEDQDKKQLDLLLNL